MRVAVLGLGEAGARIAADLVAAGVDVRGFDPVSRPAGIGLAESAAAAVVDTDVVVSVNAASVALAVAETVAASLPRGSLYADFNTASPSLKRELAEAVPVAFADVALVGVVPATGLATRALVSGDGATRFAELFAPLGMPVEPVGPEPGDAAAIKLLRSVFMKGIAVAAVETMAGAEAAGVTDRLRSDLVEILGEPLLERLLTGSTAHAVRRADEMRAAAANLEELGVEPDVARAAVRWFERLAASGA